MIYTLVCDWADITTSLMDNRFAVVTEADSYEEAQQKAARAILARFPEATEFETEDSLWESETGAVTLLALYGDRTADLVDRTEYDILHA
ncbi:hypothetical protein [Streptomyces genisteinicus]|uniref:Uncharacterized protein n=1 Tax=Streptomyces genisteinicus TaxID=2768068 RepID=A0A7H0I586_9ACTN|nr:hypothetical protein [Streptomyces genisteinicus]QNP67952.1 hypothetical protein IAG43_33850 [Streptomyces genisteinicus]